MVEWQTTSPTEGMTITTTTDTNDTITNAGGAITHFGTTDYSANPSTDTFTVSWKNAVDDESQWFPAVSIANTQVAYTWFPATYSFNCLAGADGTVYIGYGSSTPYQFDAAAGSTLTFSGTSSVMKFYVDGVLKHTFTEPTGNYTYYANAVGGNNATATTQKVILSENPSTDSTLLPPPPAYVRL